MFCGNCGKQIPEGSGFCPACGVAAGSGAPQAATATGSGGPSAAAAQRAKIEAQLKAGSQDAMQAFMVLLKDPVGGIAKSFSMFDSGRAMIVGLIFAGVYAVAATIAGVILFNSIMGIFGGLTGGGMGLGTPGFSTGPSFGMVVRMFVLYVVQAAALIAGCFLTRMIFKGAGDLNSDAYIGGACLLPAAAGALAGALLGYITWWLMLLPYLFAGCYTILMLYSGCLQIVKIEEKKAALAVPIILGISGAIVYIVLRVMM